jgi:hypothetical protein
VRSRDRGKAEGPQSRPPDKKAEVNRENVKVSKRKPEKLNPATEVNPQPSELCCDQKNSHAK